MAAAELLQELDLSQVKMAIYWKMLNELDVYTVGQVKTVSGESITAMLESLRGNSVPIEVME